MIEVKGSEVRVCGMGAEVMFEYQVLTTSLSFHIKEMGIPTEKVNRVMTTAFMKGMTLEAEFEDMKKEGEDDG